MPYAETHYRVMRDRQHRAIAGLSMGGAQTLDIAIPHADEFAYVGVFSSGVIGIVPLGNPMRMPAASPSWEQQHAARSRQSRGAKRIGNCSGSPPAKTTFCCPPAKATVELFQKHGYRPMFHESAGAHTWTNWREYLNEFAPQLFQ